MANSQDENGSSASSGSRVPRRLGGFELIEQIGRGGMGSVFKAHQVDLDRPVAVKVLSPRLARNKEFVEQFLREARAAGRLNHRSIVAAIDVGECEGFYYFAMEYVDGETLAQLIKREGPLPEDRAIEIVTEVAEALEAARHRGLIHRDIKPDNIMISRDGRVRVTDFGLAKLIDAEGSSPGDSRFLGTPAFMAPEQVRSEPDIDCRADIFSLGVTFYQMLTGKLPFTGGNTVAIAAAVIAEPLPSIRKLRPDASLAVCRVVEKMTAKNRDDRYATPADVPTALEAAAAAPKLRGRQAAGRPSGPARRVAPRRRKAPVGTYVFIGIAIAALLGILIVLLSQPPSRPQPKAPPPVAPSTVASPSTRTPIVAKPGERLFERLKKAVADAERYAADHPKSYASQIRTYRSIMDGFPPNQQVYLPREGLDLIEGIGKAIKRIREQARQGGLAELKEREQRAQALLKAGKVADAIRLLDTFPTELQNETVEAGLAALRRDTYDTIEKLYRALTAQAKALAEQKQFAKAKAVLATVAAWRIPEFTERAKAAAEGIDDLEAQQDDEAAAKARLAFPKHGLAIMARLAAREYAEAEGLLAKALVDPELKAVSDKFRDLQTILRACRDVLSRAGIGAKMYKPGQVVRVAGVTGQFVRVHDGKIYLRVSAGTGAEADTAVVAKTLGELKTGEMVGLAATGYGDNKQQAMSAVALFILAEGNAAAARQGLDAAVAKGLDVAAARDLVDRYGKRPCPTCKGEKAAPCPTCGGTGHAQVDREQCQACDGTGTAPCTKCNGRGWYACRFCKGTGRVFRGLRCANCEGRGRIDCKSCRNGRAPCAACKGTGTLTKTTPCMRCDGKKTIPCPTCDGKGELPPLEFAPPKPKPPPEEAEAAPERPDERGERRRPPPDRERRPKGKDRTPPRPARKGRERADE